MSDIIQGTPTVSEPPHGSIQKVGFWKSVFSESDGTASFSRVATGATIIGSIVWITHIVLKTHALPDFAGVSLLNATLYGLNKAHDAVSSVFGKKE